MKWTLCAVVPPTCLATLLACGGGTASESANVDVTATYKTQDPLMQEIIPASWEPTEGRWIARYVTRRSPLALGTMAKGGIKLARWYYWHDNGSPMLVVDYSTRGVPDGLWAAFFPNGDVNTQMPALQGTIDGLRVYEPGIGDVDWLQFGIDFRRQAGVLMPTPWPGCGLFKNNIKVRDLAPAEYADLAREAREVYTALKASSEF